MLYLLFSLMPMFGFQQPPQAMQPPFAATIAPLNEVIVRFRFTANNKNGLVTSAELKQTAALVASADGTNGMATQAFRPLHASLLKDMEQTGEFEAVLLSRLVAGKHKRMRPDFDPSKYGLTQSFVFKVSGEPEAWAARIKTSIHLAELGIEVVDAVPNYLSSTQADPRFQEQWYLRNHGQTGGKPGADIGAEAAWLKSRGAGVIIAIIDTGVDYLHPDLAPNIWTNQGEVPNNGLDDDGNGYIDDVLGWDFIDSTEDCDNSEDCGVADNNPMDVQGHGTHCAGLAAAAENGLGIVGVAPDATIMPLRAGYLSTGDSGILPDDAILAAVTYAVANGADIISMSFGRSANPGESLPPEFQLAIDMGVVLVCSAGNSGQMSAGFPALFPETITVGASDQLDELVYFSNYGPSVDIMAPGLDILSTQPGNRYQTLSGTSMSCPLVAGSIALLLNQQPQLTPSQVKFHIHNQAQDIWEPGFDRLTAYGRMNAPNLLGGQAPVSGYMELEQFKTSHDTPYRIYGSIAGFHDMAGFIDADPSASFSVDYRDKTGDWVNLCSGSGPRQQTICENVNFTDLDEGWQSLRLLVQQPGQAQKVTYSVVWINNMLTSLSNGDTLAMGGSQGFLDPYFSYDNVALEYCRTGEAQWHTDGFQLAPGDRGLAFTWDNGALDPSKTYEIRYRFTQSGGLVTKTYVDLKLDETMKPGWPKTFFTELYKLQIRNPPGDLTPVVYDLDGDGYKEVITYHQSGGSNLSVFDHKGQLKWARSPFKDLMPYYFLPSPLVTDLNGKGQTAILFPHLKDLYFYDAENAATLHMYDAQGQVYPGFPVKLPLSNHYWLMAADFDRDGWQEIVVLSEAGLWVFGHDGTLLHQWDDSLYPLSVPAVGDFDDDPELELAFKAYDPLLHTNTVRLADIDGQPLPDWPQDISCSTRSDLYVVDMDGDGREDVFFSGGNSGDEVQARDRKGTLLTGWPKIIPSAGKFTIADADGDGDQDIFIIGDKLYRLSDQGQVVSGWPVNTGVITKPVLADLDGDGAKVLCADFGSNPDWNGRFRTWNLAGQETFQFTKELPKIWPEGILNMPVVSDLDADGRMEILFTNDVTEYQGVTLHQSSLNVWEMKDTHFNKVPYAALFHDGANTNRASTALRDYAPYIQMPHTPSNNDWVTQALLFNPTGQQESLLMVDTDSAGQTLAMKEVHLDAMSGRWLADMDDLFPGHDGTTSQVQARLSSNSGDLTATIHLQSLDGEQDISLVFPPEDLHSSVELDHIPSASWWLGLVVQNGAQEEVQLFWEGAGEILAFPEHLNPTIPGSKKAFSLNDLISAESRPPSARLLAYEAGSKLVDGKIQGTQVAAFNNAYLLYGRNDRQRFSEGYLLPGSDASASDTLLLPLVGTAPFAEASHYDGYAVKNHGTQPGVVTVDQLDEDGLVVGQNSFSLAVGEKRVFLPQQLGFDVGRGGYLRLNNSAGKISGLFLSGDFETKLAGGRLLGSDSVSGALMGAWHEEPSTGTWLTLINTEPVARSVSLLFQSPSGETLAVVETTIVGEGSFNLDSADSPSDASAIVVRSDADAKLTGYRFRYGKLAKTLSSTCLIGIHPACVTDGISESAMK